MQTRLATALELRLLTNALYHVFAPGELASCSLGMCNFAIVICIVFSESKTFAAES